MAPVIRNAILGLAFAAFSGLAASAHAQDSMTKPGDDMKTDSMSKDGEAMKKDSMDKDKMGKDAMGSDAMKKGDSMGSDAMGKNDGDSMKKK